MNKRTTPNKPTIYDVARRAGVSIATISKVINHKGSISDRKRKEVWQAIEELDFQPNVMASALTGKPTRTVGLLVPDIANAFFAELVRHIENRCRELGYNVYVCSTDYDPVIEERSIAVLRRQRVDGIVCISGFENADGVRRLASEPFPVAVVARDFDELDIDVVAADDVMGGYLAGSHLLELGHRDIAVLARNVRSNRDRVRGFRMALERNGVASREPIDFVDAGSIESGKARALGDLSGRSPPTAIFACNEMLAIGAIEAVEERGMSVPEDISVVSYDGSLLATIARPALTTIAQPTMQIGERAVDWLDLRIRGERSAGAKLLLPPRLVVRNSTGMAPRR